MEAKSKQDIRVYIGGCAKLPNNESSLRNIISRLEKSKLYSSKIVLIHTADWHPYDFLRTSNLDIEYVNTGRGSSAFEFPALRKIWQDSQASNFYGLYLHCKGSSKTDVIEIENALKWSSLMMDGLIDHSESCLKHLDNGADIVGSMWVWHFKGNFFWFNSIYTKCLPDPCNSKIDISDRFHAEYWITYPFFFENYEIRYPRVKNLFYPDDIINDNEFRQSKYNVKLDEKKVCEDFTKFIETKTYFIFDKIIVSYYEFLVFKELFKKYLNYDGVLVIKEQQRSRNFESICIY